MQNAPRLNPNQRHLLEYSDPVGDAAARRVDREREKTVRWRASSNTIPAHLNITEKTILLIFMARDLSKAQARHALSGRVAGSDVFGIIDSLIAADELEVSK